MLSRFGIWLRENVPAWWSRRSKRGKLLTILVVIALGLCGSCSILAGLGSLLPDPTPTATTTVTATATATPTYTAEPSPTRTPTRTKPPTRTPRPTRTPQPTSTPTDTPRPSSTPKPTWTKRPTLTPTETVVPTETLVPTATVVPTMTLAPTPRPVVPTSVWNDCVYIGNRNTKKFHSPLCRGVRDMNEENKVCLRSREEAIAQGYVPCGWCKP